MEKKLELRHLAAYFPHELKCHAMGAWEHGTEYDENPKPVTFIIHGILKNKVSIKDFNNKELVDYDECFPILRPLSDLTKEIEVNGDVFIPLHELPSRAIFFNIKTTKKYIESGRLEQRFIEKLLSWHFDVFGLIDAGLAIDINTLEKQ